MSITGTISISIIGGAPTPARPQTRAISDISGISWRATCLRKGQVFVEVNALVLSWHVALRIKTWLVP
jgi:hypothetical protein